jgi:hypothetical protein
MAAMPMAPLDDYQPSDRKTHNRNLIFNIPRVATAELLAEIRNQQTEGLEDEVMVLGQLLHQRQS